MMAFSLKSLSICFLFGVTLCSELPFQCPYKVPKDDPQPTSGGIGEGGFLPLLSLKTNTSDQNAQYRAALALVPCDAQGISVFTTPMIKGDFTVSVIYVYDKPVDELKGWLEKKYYATTGYDKNPIADAVAKQCPKIAEEQKSGYAKRLSGDEILNIICEETCEKPNECATIPSDVCEIADCTKEKAAQLCPSSCSKEPSTYTTPAPIYDPTEPTTYPTPAPIYDPTEPSTHPTAGPIYYKPFSPLRNKRDTKSVAPRQSYAPFTVFHQPQYHQPAPQAPHYQQYPQPVTHAPHYQQYPQYEYKPKISFDDAPALVYGVARRTRRTVDCNEPGSGCAYLEHAGNVVQCDIPRFSGCESEWLDCVKEDEKYLRTETDYYDKCTETENSGEILPNVSDNECSSKRKCVNGQNSNDAQPHIGHDPFDSCTCTAKKNDLYSGYAAPTRYERQAQPPQVGNVGTGEAYATTSQNTRVLRAKGGASKKVVDTLQKNRKTGYTPARQIATIEEDLGATDGFIR